MAKKESTTAETLAEDLARLRGLHGELKSGITSMEQEVALLEERDMECARRGFRGEDVRKERTKLQETLAAKRAALDVARRDLGILEAELARVEVDHAAAQRQADDARVVTLIQEVDAEAAALAEQLRQTLIALSPRVRAMQAKYVEVLQLWVDLGRGEFLGSRPAIGVRAIMSQALAGLKARGGRSMRVTCPGCGNEVVGGFERPAHLCWCSSACAVTHGVPDPVVRALREIEAAARPPQ